MWQNHTETSTQSLYKHIYNHIYTHMFTCIVCYGSFTNLLMFRGEKKTSTRHEEVLRNAEENLG